MGRINKNDEVAKALGTFAGDFAVIEFLLIKMFALALGHKNLARSQATFGRIRNIADRIAICEDVVKVSSLSAARKKKMIEFLAEMKNVNATRNKYMHGLYETDLRGNAVRITTYATTSDRKQETKALDANGIAADIKIARVLTANIMKRLFPKDMRPPIETGRAPPPSPATRAKKNPSSS